MAIRRIKKGHLLTIAVGGERVSLRVISARDDEVELALERRELRFLPAEIPGDALLQYAEAPG